jgi:hypothetical protein
MVLFDFKKMNYTQYFWGIEQLFEALTLGSYWDGLEPVEYYQIEYEDFVVVSRYRRGIEGFDKLYDLSVDASWVGFWRELSSLIENPSCRNLRRYREAALINRLLKEVYYSIKSEMKVVDMNQIKNKFFKIVPPILYRLMDGYWSVQLWLNKGSLLQNIIDKAAYSDYGVLTKMLGLDVGLPSYYPKLKHRLFPLARPARFISSGPKLQFLEFLLEEKFYKNTSRAYTFDYPLQDIPGGAFNEIFNGVIQHVIPKFYTWMDYLILSDKKYEIAYHRENECENIDLTPDTELQRRKISRLKLSEAHTMSAANHLGIFPTKCQISDLLEKNDPICVEDEWLPQRLYLKLDALGLHVEMEQFLTISSFDNRILGIFIEEIDKWFMPPEAFKRALSEFQIAPRDKV